MMLLKIAFRNVFRQKRRSILTALTIFGGFTLAAVSIGWSDGSYTYIIDMFTRNRLGHIQIHRSGYLDKPSMYLTIDDVQEIGEKIEKLEQVEAWTPRVYSAGLVSVDEKSAGVQIIGIDPLRETTATHFNKKMIAGRCFSATSAPEAIIGQGLAQILGAAVDDEIVIVTQAADGSIANAGYRIIGMAKSGDEISDRTAFYLRLRDAQELLVLDERVHEIVVIARHLNDVRTLIQTMENTLDDSQLDVALWWEFARSFYQAMKADQEGMWIMLLVIILIVVVGVLNTVLMSVLERRREYGVLKAVGNTPAQIFRMVLYEVNIIAFAGVVLGCGVGTLLNSLLAEKGIKLPEPFTYGGIEFDTMYSAVNARSLYIPAIVILLSATIISIFPSLKAARTEPARAMRLH